MRFWFLPVCLVAFVSVASKEHEVTPALSEVLRHTSRVVLASHGRVGWFDIVSGSFDVIHENEGVYHGVAAGQFVQESLKTIWIVQRPHNVGKHAQMGSKNSLLHVDSESGQVLARLPLDSQFTHESMQHGSDLFVCDTGRGRVLRYEATAKEENPRASWHLRREYPLFTRRDHINTLAMDGKRLLVGLHNSGRQSNIVAVDLDSGEIVDRYPGLGVSCHGCSPWRDQIIYLASPEGALVKLPKNHSQRRFAYQDPSEPKRFAKGLVVIGDIAIFGLSKPMERGNRDDPNNNADVVVFDLEREVVLLRTNVQTRGLLNAIAAPQLFDGTKVSLREEL